MVREQIGNFLAVAGFHYLTTLLSWLLFWQLLEMRWFDFCEEWIIFPSKSFVSLIHLLLLRTFTAPKISRWNSRLASLEQKFRFWPFHKPLMHREFEPERWKDDRSRAGRMRYCTWRGSHVAPPNLAFALSETQASLLPKSSARRFAKKKT